jgi:hypothetical protein
LRLYWPQAHVHSADHYGSGLVTDLISGCFGSVGNRAEDVPHGAYPITIELRFESLKVVDIMTRRTVISALPEDMTLAASITQVSQTPGRVQGE